MSIPNRPVTLIALTLWAIGSVVLASAGYGIGTKRPTANQARTVERLRPPKELEALALKATATQHNLLPADLEIDNSWIFTYEYTGQRANVYSVTDNRTDKAYQIAFDDNGHILDLSKLAADDLAAKVARYGKPSPYLFEYLKQAPPDEEIGVNVYLNLGPDTADQPKDDPPMDSEKLKRMSPQERRDYDQKALDFERRSKAYNAARAQRVVDPVVQRLKEMGYHAEVLGNTGFISLKLRPAMIKEVETWREVRGISSDPNDKPNSGSRPPKFTWVNGSETISPIIALSLVPVFPLPTSQGRPH